MQGASVCIDNTTGMVRAIVGGRSQDDVEGYTLNRAFQSFRQPGSAIKPLIVYTPALGGAIHRIPLWSTNRSRMDRSMAMVLIPGQ